MKNIEEKVKQCIELYQKMIPGESVNDKDIRESLLYKSKYNQFQRELNEAYEKRDLIHKNWHQEKDQYEKELLEKNPDGRHTFEEFQKWQGIHDKAKVLMEEPVQNIIRLEKAIQEMKQTRDRFSELLLRKHEEFDKKYNFEINSIEVEIKMSEERIKQLQIHKEKINREYRTEKPEFDRNYKSIASFFKDLE